MTGRAKWDSWKSTGDKYKDDKHQAEMRYIEIAKDCGWDYNSNPQRITETTANGEPTAEELLDGDEQPHSSGGGMGLGVSTVSDEKAIVDVDTLHGFALAGESDKLLQFLEENPDADLDTVDEFVSPSACRAHSEMLIYMKGYTPLHLASDRGNANIILLLLEKGADATLKVLSRLKV